MVYSVLRNDARIIMADKNVRVCWASGSYFGRRKILDRIKALIGECDTYVYDDISGEYFESQVLSSCLFGDKKIIILKTLPKFDGSSTKSTSRLKKALSGVAEDCVVIIDGVEPSTHKTIYDHVKSIGRVYDSPQYLKGGEATSFVANILEEYKKIAGEGCVDLIIDATGETGSKGVDTDRLFMNIKQLCSYIGKAKVIEKSDILSVLGRNTDFIIWNLFSALDRRDFEQCMKLFYNSLSLSGKPEEAINQILYMVSWRYRLILFLKEQKNLGRSTEEILESVKGIKKTKREGSGLYSTFEYDLDAEGKTKSVYTEKASKDALLGFFGNTPVINLYAVSDIYHILKCVSHCLFRMRSGSSDAENIMLVNNLFMTVCGVFDSSVLCSVRRESYD